ncbi:MAG: alkaline phosphatase family protein [Bacteroidota bacterium]
MQKIILFFLFAPIVCKLSVSAQPASLYPQKIDHVIIIGVDGMSPDGIRTASTPVMHSLIDNGSVKWNVRTVLPSSSSPNWASMIMGGGTELHGITDNDWEREEYSLPAIVSDEEGIFPTIFGWVRKYKPGAEIGVAYQWKVSEGCLKKRR